MTQDELITLWETGNRRLLGDDQIDQAMIEKYLKEKTLKGSFHLKFIITFYWLVQVANLILLSMNLAGYIKNPVMTRILVPQVILTIGIMIYGMEIFYRLREINNYSQSIQQLISRQIRFFRGAYEIWLILASLSAIILINNVNFYIDNDQGVYHIYNKALYSMVTLAAFLIIYGTQKLTSIKWTRSLKAYLKDLQEGSLEQSRRIEGQRRRFLWLYVVVFLLLMISLVFGIVHAVA